MNKDLVLEFTLSSPLMAYVPSEKALTQLPRRFLFAVLYHVKPETYTEYLRLYKTMKERSLSVKFAEYLINANSELYSKLTTDSDVYLETVIF